MVIWTDNAISHITEFIDGVDVGKALRKLKRNMR